MKKTQLNLLAILFLATAFMVSCSNDDDATPDSDGDHSEIHKLVVMVTNENGATTEYEFEAEHDHGDGTDDDHDHDHEEVEIELSPNHTYMVQMVFENEDHEDVTSELTPEEHLVCFESEEGLNIMAVRNDSDANGIEVGFDSTWTTGDASEGHLEVLVRHQIGKASIGTEDCDAGATDVEAEFHVHIE